MPSSVSPSVSAPVVLPVVASVVPLDVEFVPVSGDTVVLVSSDVAAGGSEVTVDPVELVDAAEVVPKLVVGVGSEVPEIPEVSEVPGAVVVWEVPGPAVAVE